MDIDDNPEHSKEIPDDDIATLVEIEEFAKRAKRLSTYELNRHSAEIHNDLDFLKAQVQAERVNYSSSELNLGERKINLSERKLSVLSSELTKRLKTDSYA